MKKIYEAQDFMIRYPKFSCDNLITTENIDEFLIMASENRKFMEQLLVASESTYKMLNDCISGNVILLKSKNKFKIFETVYKYWNRSHIRTTPFGLFSKVNIGSFGNKNDLEINPDLDEKSITIDTEWLLKFIKLIENDMKDKLHYTLNNAAYILGDRVYLMYCLNEKNIERKNIRFTNVYSIIENSCRGEFKTLHSITNILLKDYGVEHFDNIKHYLDNLIDNEFLVSELYFSLMDNNPLKRIMEIISIRDKDNVHVKYILNIIDKMELYKSTEIGFGEKILLEIIRTMKEKVECSNYIQVDCFSDDSITLNKKSKYEIEEFISFLMYISSKDRFSYTDHYKDKFIEKYGVSQEVSLLEMFDKGIGIEAPYGYNNPQNEVDDHVETLMITDEEENELINMYEKAVKSDTDIDLSCLEYSIDYDKFKLSNATKSLELYFSLTQENKEISLNLSGVIGSKMAGKSFGRFAHMNGRFAELLLEINNKNEEYEERNTEICEITLLSDISNHSNVMRTINTFEKELSLYTTNSKAKNNNVFLKNIYVGIENNKFYFRNIDTGKRIVFRMTNMYNLEMISNELRFLLEASDISYDWHIFAWNNTYRKFNYIPKIKYKNIIIAPKQWKIQLEEFGNVTKLSDVKFSSLLKEYFKENKIPYRFYFCEQDNKILLDLYNENDALIFTNELKKNYRKFKHDYYALIKDVENGEDVILSEDNSYKSEIVVPLFKIEKEKSDNLSINESSIRESLVSRSLLPFEDLLYYKIYIKNERQNEFISDYLDDIVGENQYFYMRYADPKPHIRIRLFGKAEDLFRMYINNIEVFKNLMDSAIISNVQLETYDREVERYGGLELLEIVEELFFIDSKIMQNLIILYRNKELNLELEDISVISNFYYLKCFMESYDEMLIFLESLGINKTSPTSNIKNKNKMYIEILSKNESSDLVKIKEFLVNRDIYIQKVIDYFNNHNFSTIKRLKIIDSIIHLSNNRLIGIDREKEKHILEVIRTIVLAFKHKK